MAWRGDTLSDGDGLSGEVRANSDNEISIRFKYAFKWKRKVTWHQCGTWPTSSLDAIRQERDRARDLVRAGINPSDQRKAARIEAQAKVDAVIAEAERQVAERRTNREMFEAWIMDGVVRADGNAELRRLFEKDLLPPLGDLEVRQTTDVHLRDTLRKVGRDRKCPGLAAMLLADLRQMYRWAEKRKPWRPLLVEGNPAELVDLKGVVPVGYKPGIGERVLDGAEIRELRDIFERMEADYEAAPDRRRAARPVQKQTQIAMWISLCTLCRIGELLKARWENVDLEAGEWLVPAEDTKTKVEWLVFLSEFALAHFKELHRLTGTGKWCFPANNGKGSLNTKTMAKQVGDRQIQFKKRKELRCRRNDNSLVVSGGRNGSWTPHDMRRTGATMMQELGIVPDTIDRCQNHVLAGSKVRRHYLHYDFAQQKLEAWEALGKRLQKILDIDPPEVAPDEAESRTTAQDQDSGRRSWVRRRPWPVEAIAASGMSDSIGIVAMGTERRRGDR
jgi:integrase